MSDKREVVSAVFLCAVVCLSGSVLADVKFLDTQISYVISDFTFEEFDQRGRVNEESGTLTGVQSKLKYQRSSFAASLSASIMTDVIAHDGVTQSGNEFLSKTNTEVININANTSWYVMTLYEYDFAVSVGIGYRDWERDILSTQRVVGIKETYQWLYYIGGFEVFREFGEQTLSFNLSKRFADRVNEQVDFKNDLDGFTLSPDSDSAFIASVQWRRAISDHWALHVETDYVRWDFNQSAVAVLTRNQLPVGMAFQPANKTKVKIFRIGLGYRF